MTRDVIVVGGGVIGCSIALALSRAGLTATLLERGRVGCESSRAAAGMLGAQSEASGPGPFFDLCMRSRAMYPEFAELLGELSGIDVEHRREGALFILHGGQRDVAINRWAQWQTAAGLAIERLSSDDLRKLEPEITEAAHGAVFVPGDHQVENRRLMDAFAIALSGAGVQVFEGTEATG